DAPSRTLAPSNAAPSSTQYEPATRGEPSTRREERVALHEVEVMDVNEIPEGEARGVEVDGREITLCKLGEEVFALSGACSYHPIPLRGAKLEGEVLTCRWYGAQFDVRTGESV